MNFDQLYIGGKWIPSDSGDWIDVENPATREIIGRVPRGNGVDVDKAVKAASLAFSDWANTSVEERIGYMEKVLEYMLSQKQLLIDLETGELGAPVKWAERAHVNGPIGRLENFIRLIGKYEFVSELKHGKVVKEPIGVVGCLTPWNYPLGQVMQKIVPAILCGNTVVLKPSQIAPLSAGVLAKAFEYAGVPDGVFNLVTGRAGEVGNALALHEKVDMISFTGSTNGGKEVGKLALEGVKKIALELGGKSANVILKGADYEKAVKTGLSSCFDNTGQTCAALTRMLVPRDELSKIEDMIIEHAKTFIVGDPKLVTTHIGPLASLKQYEKVKKYIEIGIEEGARLIVGEVPGAIETGYFVKPCVFTDVRNDMRIAQEEIFGPVICVIPFDTIEEAIEIANDTIYGLSGAVFGPKEDAKRVALAMKTGSVYINDGKRDIDAPFGGYKQSGIGREGGTYGIDEFLEIKAVFDEENKIVAID
jgi:acyl-CoA reductase-like NAD-dependent aldehyde dehydrogenase